MIRTALAVAVLAFGATALVAQSDPIAARKALMKANGDQNRVATEMLEGKRPFNLDEAKKVLATFAETGEKAPALFPDDISRAIANAGGEDLVIAIQSPHFEIEGETPDPGGRWATVEKILFAGPLRRIVPWQWDWFDARGKAS